MITPPKIATKLLHDVLRVALVVTVPQQVRDGVVLGGRRGAWGNGAIIFGAHNPKYGGWVVCGTALV